jgi:hypothetical protein
MADLSARFRLARESFASSILQPRSNVDKVVVGVLESCLLYYPSSSHEISLLFAAHLWSLKSEHGIKELRRSVPCLEN